MSYRTSRELMFSKITKHNPSKFYDKLTMFGSGSDDGTAVQFLQAPPSRGEASKIASISVGSPVIPDTDNVTFLAMMLQAIRPTDVTIVKKKRN